MEKKLHVSSRYFVGLFSNDNPCTGCSAYEYLGHCGTWGKDCSVISDKDTYEQIMDTLNWDIMDMYKAIEAVEKYRKEEEAKELDLARAKELAENTPSIDVIIEAYIEDDIMESFIESLLK